MRNILPLVLAAGLLLTSLVTVPAQSGSPETQARNFYAWYLHELNADRSPIQNSAGLRKYVTARMVGAIERALQRENGIDADIFIDAQDFDSAWEKNITSSKAVITGGRSSLTITLKGGPAFGTKRLRLVLKKEAGVWKIDSVNGYSTP